MTKGNAEVLAVALEVVPSPDYFITHTGEMAAAELRNAMSKLIIDKRQSLEDINKKQSSITEFLTAKALLVKQSIFRIKNRLNEDLSGDQVIGFRQRLETADFITDSLSNIKGIATACEDDVVSMLEQSMSLEADAINCRATIAVAATCASWQDPAWEAGADKIGEKSSSIIEREASSIKGIVGLVLGLFLSAVIVYFSWPLVQWSWTQAQDFGIGGVIGLLIAAAAGLALASSGKPVGWILLTIGGIGLTIVLLGAVIIIAGGFAGFVISQTSDKVFEHSTALDSRQAYTMLTELLEVYSCAESSETPESSALLAEISDKILQGQAAARYIARFADDENSGIEDLKAAFIALYFGELNQPAADWL